MTTSRNPQVAAVLSLLVPGLGQWYAGQRGVAIAMLCTVAGMLGSIVLFHSATTTLTMAVLYVVVAISAAGDAARVAAGQPSTFREGTRWQIVLLLLTIGPFALPLLWQSQRFSRGAKIGWTLAVILIAIVSVMFLGAMGSAVEQLLNDGAAIP